MRGAGGETRNCLPLPGPGLRASPAAIRLVLARLGPARLGPPLSGGRLGHPAGRLRPAPPAPLPFVDTSPTYRHGTAERAERGLRGIPPSSRSESRGSGAGGLRGRRMEPTGRSRTTGVRALGPSDGTHGAITHHVRPGAGAVGWNPRGDRAPRASGRWGRRMGPTGRSRTTCVRALGAASGSHGCMLEGVGGRVKKGGWAGENRMSLDGGGSSWRVGVDGLVASCGHGSWRGPSGGTHAATTHRVRRDVRVVWLWTVLWRRVAADLGGGR